MASRKPLGRKYVRKILGAVHQAVQRMEHADSEILRIVSGLYTAFQPVLLRVLNANEALTSCCSFSFHTVLPNFLTEFTYGRAETSIERHFLDLRGRHTQGELRISPFQVGLRACQLRYVVIAR